MNEKKINTVLMIKTKRILICEKKINTKKIT